jgi:hypothetical protein
VLVAGLTDNTRLSRTTAVWLISAAVFLVAIPPSDQQRDLHPWDLTFGSGMQTLGCLLAVITVGWCMSRSTALSAMAREGGPPVPTWLIYWIRFGIPAAILAVGIWWLMTSVPSRRERGVANACFNLELAAGLRQPEGGRRPRDFRAAETWLVHLIRMADDDPEMTLVRLAKEEEGVGISMGAHLPA